MFYGATMFFSRQSVSLIWSGLSVYNQTVSFTVTHFALIFSSHHTLSAVIQNLSGSGERRERVKVRRREGRKEKRGQEERDKMKGCSKKAKHKGGERLKDKSEWFYSNQQNQGLTLYRETMKNNMVPQS